MNGESKIKTEKARLRSRIDAALEQLTVSERALAGAEACKRLSTTMEWTQAGSVLAFAPMSGEINIWPLLTNAIVRGVKIALPRYDRQTKAYSVCLLANLDEDLEQGYYGIREPREHCATLQAKLLDLILVPGVAFDLQGRRLGRGKGFYDRLLGTWRGVTCGVAYDEQIVDDVPVEAHDVHLDYILTPRRFVRTRGLE